MVSPVSGALVLLASSLLVLLCGVWCVVGQDLRETDALCSEDSCFVAYFQRKTFLDSWRACKKRGGNLATIKHKRDAAMIASLFSNLDLRHSRTKVQVWIGLQRQPRQCTSTRPLRGFSWTTGDQDTEFTNWLKEDSPSTCSVSRCVVMSYNTQDHTDNLKWLDGACSVAVDGYLCHYAFEGMCVALWSEGAGNALYTTPFNLLSTLLTHVPFGSVATMPCPEGTNEEQSVLCMQREDGSVGWSREPPLCSSPPVSQSWCEQDNGGCEHYCKPAGGHSYCECADGYELGDDGQSCELTDFCRDAPCESECLPLSDGYRCACPEGFMLTPDERGCLDVDECLQSPCEHLCVNTAGSFECGCREGYQLDESGGCEVVDECGHNPCEHVCENTPGSHLCHCRLGYSPMPEDPSRCQDDDECRIPGTCEQMCSNSEGGFECYCVEGYELRDDHFSCRKRGEEDHQSAATPAFPWGTHQPAWDPEYDWTQQSHTDWPLEEEPSLDWMTDPPRVQDSDVIWVTSSAQEELPFHSAPTKEEEEWLQRSEPDLEALPNTTYPTPPPTHGSMPTPSWYNEDEEEETTTAPPLLSTSTISGGAWNWWATTSSQDPGNPDDPVIDYNNPTDSSDQSDQEQPPLRKNPELPEEDLGEEEEEITRSQDPTVPIELPPSQPPTSVGEGSTNTVDPEEKEEERLQNSTWLLVGLLVPLCIFIVVMVALGIVYCTRCAVQPRNKNATDCYHWISGAHDKQGAAPPSAGVKSQV
ncbi:CD248 molecule, endosialin a [Notolabrus celidotus]|uniref:CD248 molecule, endosialin a n=1 Tax=Notolabrus celidotus TaxID=1203425 RepID=UPI00148F9EFE|nr:CD248 molecule, endosialin a [Notolabrus celidotus]